MTLQWPEEVVLWKGHREGQAQKKSRRKKQRGKRNGQQVRLERSAAADYAAMVDYMKVIRQKGGDA